jgi:hypothetical protein
MNNRAEVLNEFHSRLLAKCTPALNTGTALDMLILVGQTLAEMQADLGANRSDKGVPSMIWRYLFHGSDVLTMPKTWLADTDRLAQYEAYTKRQWFQGRVVRGVEETRRAAFWQRVEAKRPVCRVAQFGGRRS